jgi:hypothetical protein
MMARKPEARSLQNTTRSWLSKAVDSKTGTGITPKLKPGARAGAAPF